MNLTALLSHARVVAVVGCSPDPRRTSHEIGQYLLDAGYTVLPINPFHPEILGQRAYPTLADVPVTLRVDLVNVFRQPAHTLGVVEEVIAWRDRTGQTPTVWTQLGVSSPEAEARAADAGIPYIANRCILVEHQQRRG